MSGAAAEPTTEVPTLADIDRLVGEVTDPEIPVLTIADLGVLRSVRAETDDGGRRIVVSITPTYSGCPAMHDIEARILEVLRASGVDGSVETVWSPAWTTDWMSDEGRRKLRDYGIAPPNPTGPSHGFPGSAGTAGGEAGTPVTIAVSPRAADWASSTRSDGTMPETGQAGGELVACPRCSSNDTEVISEFGSTACKALYRCRACAEPFDYFKGH
ncbi:MAG: iron-sulfur cluster assembly protein [Acidimicrobiales bacterium]